MRSRGSSIHSSYSDAASSPRYSSTASRSVAASRASSSNRSTSTSSTASSRHATFVLSASNQPSVRGGRTRDKSNKLPRSFARAAPSSSSGNSKNASESRSTARWRWSTRYVRSESVRRGVANRKGEPSTSSSTCPKRRTPSRGLVTWPATLCTLIVPKPRFSARGLWSRGPRTEPNGPQCMLDPRLSLRPERPRREIEESMADPTVRADDKLVLDHVRVQKIEQVKDKDGAAHEQVTV